MRSKFATAFKSTPLLRSAVVMLTVLLLFLVSAALWTPAYLANIRNEKAITELNAEVQRLDRDVSMRKAVMQGGNSVAAIIGKVNQDVTQTSLVTELNRIVSKTGVSIAEQTFREVADEAGIRQFKQLLHVSGEYKEIRYFLSQVQEKLSGLNVIERLSLSRAKEKARVEARIELVTYTVVDK